MKQNLSFIFGIFLLGSIFALNACKCTIVVTDAQPPLDAVAPINKKVSWGNCENAKESSRPDKLLKKGNNKFANPRPIIAETILSNIDSVKN